MLFPTSITAAFSAIARVLCVVGRVVTLPLRRGGHPTLRRKNPRTRPAESTPSASSPALPATKQRAPEERTPARSPSILPEASRQTAFALRGEYRVIPISCISPAATPLRLVYEGIERLAASIAGSADREGLGLLVPIVVRILDDGGYEVIDGQRRILACQQIAARSGAEDCLIPAIAFNVSPVIAQLMRVASLDAPEPTPIELSGTYKALRDLMAEEGSYACSARGLTLVSHHGKTQLAGYLRIANAVSDVVMVAAGLVTSDGLPTREALVDLTRSQLLDAATDDTVRGRAATLKSQLDRLNGHGRSSSRRSTEAGASADQEGDGIARTNGPTLSIIARTRTMPPSEARALIEHEMAPAMIALVEQAHGGRDAEGYYAEFSKGHACLVLPRDVEGLTLEQLDRLDRTLAMLASRTRRAREERLQVGALISPLGERKTS